MPTSPAIGPIGLVAPWWRDYNKAVADGKVTKAEVKTLLAPHKDQFDDKLFGKAMKDLAGGKDSHAKATVYAKKELNALLAPPAPHPWFPTHDQMAKTYGNIARSAVEHGTAKKLTQAPAGYANAPEFDITPKGLMGSHQSVYLIKGELYLASRPVVPNAKTTWFACGPAPLF